MQSSEASLKVKASLYGTSVQETVYGMYKHQDTNESWISLHDSSADKMEFGEGMLHFFFPKGIWILGSHKDNGIGKVVKSGAAEVWYELLYPEDDVTVYIYKTKTADKSVRKEWKLRVCF